MAQTWRDLMFAHWRVPASVLKRRLPSALTVDTFDGSGWIGVTPFELTGLRLRGTLPAPLVSRFPELNVRTYATLDDKPGIFFLSLDAANALAVFAARRAYRLPYFRAEMGITRRWRLVHYASRRTSSDGPHVSFAADYWSAGPKFQAEPGSLDYFLTERYCLYTVDERGRPLRADIHHPPWPLQPADASISRNTMTAPWGIELPNEEPVLHYSQLQQVVIWPLGPAG
jgi:uncharacterized protein YqjF (DUF2071 family)